jgi:2-keto-4-pentenoate hydratase/2-oxohepta-3-ene-1,7-dioic acid hydratase in catechol pathway
MKLAAFSINGVRKTGVVVGGGLIDLERLDPALNVDIMDIVEQGDTQLSKIRKAVAGVSAHLQLSEVVLEAPIRKPGKFLAIGMNYEKHAEEARKKGITVPKKQFWFNKQVTCVTGPYHDVDMPSVSTQLDYEAEMAFVIGKRCRHVSVEDAASVIAGFMVCNDFSVRDWQMHTMTFTMGKSFDTHGPIGPWLVTPDEIDDPHNLEISCYVNGEQRQSSNTSDLIHNCYEQIAYLSTAFTLEPGDIIATGTPAGVGLAMAPPRFLCVGDVVRCEVEGLGFIENTIVAETV